MNEEEKTLRERFTEMVTDQVGKGVYVWGGNGELLNAMPNVYDWIDRHETSEENRDRAIRLYLSRLADNVHDVRAFDCSGLVYWALKTLGVQKTDVSSRGLYALCKPIRENELMSGDLVFHHDGTQIVHVGVCVGNEQVECRGRDVGVVRNKRKSGYWNRFGRLPAFETDKHAAVVIKGGSVRVRTGDGTYAPCVGIVHRGERYPLLGTAPSGWYRIEWCGTEAYITNKPQYTEVRDG